MKRRLTVRHLLDRLGRLGGPGRRLLTVEKIMFLLDGILNLGSLREEIKILANRRGSYVTSIPESIIVVGVLGFFELISKPVIGVFKLQSIAIVVSARKALEGIVGL